MLQAVLPLCPNKPWVIIKFRPACPRDLAALMLAGLNYIYNTKQDHGAVIPKGPLRM